MGVRGISKGTIQSLHFVLDLIDRNVKTKKDMKGASRKKLRRILDQIFS